MEAIIIALIVGITGVGGQWLLRRQDYKRQDEVANRVAMVAKQVKDDSASIQQQLTVIHTLVNAELASAKVNAIDSTKAMLATMGELIRVKEKLGIPPSQDTLLTMEVIKSRIKSMEKDMGDR